MIIEFTKTAWEKINTYIRLADGEISGLGISSLSPGKTKIIVKDIRIWKQECTDSSTEIIDNAHMIELVEEFRKDKIPMEDINIWWHSHADMGSWFSPTDEETIENWINQKYLVAIVGNKKKEFKGKIAIKEPIPCSLNDVDVREEIIAQEENTTLIKNIKKEIKKKIKKPTPVETTKEFTLPIIKKENFYIEYQEQTKHLEPKLRRNFLIDNAKTCECWECLAWLNKNKKKFPFKSHIYDVIDQAWKTEVDYEAGLYNWDDDKNKIKNKYKFGERIII